MNPSDSLADRSICSDLQPMLEPKMVRLARPGERGTGRQNTAPTAYAFVDRRWTPGLSLISDHDDDAAS